MFSLKFLNALRSAEIEKIVPLVSPGARILEIGAGTGEQAAKLSQRGFDVSAIEIPSSDYSADRLFPITNYDGLTIPFPDRSFDVVFSSNVLEHVPDLAAMHAEIKRVLRPGGFCLHVLPTHIWRFWTMLAGPADAVLTFVSSVPQLVPRSLDLRREIPRLADAWYRTARRCVGLVFPWRHGERGTGISELALFHPRWWRRNFEENGFILVSEEPMGLFYTGTMLLGPSLGFAKRAALANYLGSACHFYKIEPAQN